MGIVFCVGMVALFLGALLTDGHNMGIYVHTICKPLYTIAYLDTV